MASDLLGQLFSVASRWSLRAPWLAFALLLPVCVVALGDWRIRRTR
jgi:hypothetical protein